jgi:hypothetical protein
MPPSSANTNASSNTAKAPMTQLMIAAGPAMVVAFSAPSSQPEPITEPTEVKRTAIRPTSRFSAGFCADSCDEPFASPPGVAAWASKTEMYPLLRSET